MRTLLIIFLMMAIAGCKNKVVQYPVDYDDDRQKFMQFSQNLNKEILKMEQEMIDSYVDSLDLNFTKTQYGFWISNSGELKESMARSGDRVVYQYRIDDFEGNRIYSKSENGVQDIVVGKSEMPRGLQTAIRMIEEGDSAMVLMPSVLAYGVYGDRDKIGSNEPLIFTLFIENIQKLK